MCSFYLENQKLFQNLKVLKILLETEIFVACVYVQIKWWCRNLMRHKLTFLFVNYRKAFLSSKCITANGSNSITTIQQSIAVSQWPTCCNQIIERRECSNFISVCWKRTNILIMACYRPSYSFVMWWYIYT
jgi:hypothetical protein